MASVEGRMIIKEISYDARIWGLSDRSRSLFPFCIPHIENDGTLPRKARTMRLTCFPLAALADDDIEQVILEWIASKLCEEASGRLIFIDFDGSNSNLDFIRKRKERKEAKERNTLINNNSNSNRKGIRISPDCPDMSRNLPSASATPKPLTDVQKIVRAYKGAKGNDVNDKGWDKANFARYAKAAKSLLECFGGDVLAAQTWLVGTGMEWTQKEVTWTLETINRHAWDNRASLMEKLNEQPRSEVGADRVLGHSGRARITQAGSLAKEVIADMGGRAIHPPDARDKRA